MFKEKWRTAYGVEFFITVEKFYSPDENWRICMGGPISDGYRSEKEAIEAVDLFRPFYTFVKKF